jgi:tyrocidine synthetase-3
LTPNGKIDYRRLGYMSRRAGDVRDDVPPATAMERTIAEIWRSVLGTDTVGLHDNFFDLGGHSLMVVKVVSRIEKRMGIRVPLGEFFGQTLGQFAASCEQAVRAKEGVYAS